MSPKPCLAIYLLAVFCCLAPSAQAVDGDINIDGQVNAADILWSEQVLFNSRSLSSEQLIQGDLAPLVSGVPQPDGVFNLGDVFIISRIALGLLNYSFPENQFNIGDSIGEGEAADGTIGEAHHETVWSTGYNGSDTVISFNERFEFATAVDYYENNVSRDTIFNHAVSGAVMADFAIQAEEIVAASAMTPTGKAGTVTVFLGNNDVCAASNAEMTDPGLFDAQYRAGLDVLASNEATRNAQIHISGIPAIYWLWNAKHTRFWCRVFVWPFVPCENLLENPADDCESSISREDPDNNDYSGDGPACKRRKTFHSLVRGYNTILHDTLEEYRSSGSLPNARYTDIYDVKFESMHVNNGDCFHPSTEGHAFLAEKEWCKTHWGIGDPACSN
ncbi:MAG: hypothetical protein LJE83_08345 [Gammaproteobacteria bacterium]|nr:hypothetical protein [Gammaproteobacteria bacterium]